MYIQQIEFKHWPVKHNYNPTPKLMPLVKLNVVVTLKQKNELFDSTTEPQCLHFSENQPTNRLSLVISTH